MKQENYRRIRRSCFPIENRESVDFKSAIKDTLRHVAPVVEIPPFATTSKKPGTNQLDDGIAECVSPSALAWRTPGIIVINNNRLYDLYRNDFDQELPDFSLSRQLLNSPMLGRPEMASALESA